jgi:hypothetical protein
MNVYSSERYTVEYTDAVDSGQYSVWFIDSAAPISVHDTLEEALIQVHELEIADLKIDAELLKGDRT